jgi:hypothetical protein
MDTTTGRERELWITWEDGFFDCKPLFETLEKPIPDFTMSMTLHGDDLTSYEKYIELERHWQQRFRTEFDAWLAANKK